MIKIDFWVEGIADQKFLADVITKWYGLSFSFKDKTFECLDPEKQFHLKIRNTGGIASFITKDGWKNIERLFEINKENGVKNIVIPDADDNHKNQTDRVLATTEGVITNETLYLWPDNQSNGDLENLLEKIIHPDHQTIFDCWNAYENCLKQQSGKKYTTPARKTKIYAYLEALLGETKSEKKKIKEPERDYTNANHWILDENHTSLKPLKNFLDPHLKPKVKVPTLKPIINP